MFCGGKDLRCGMDEHPYHIWHECSSNVVRMYWHAYAVLNAMAGGIASIPPGNGVTSRQFALLAWLCYVVPCSTLKDMRQLGIGGPSYIVYSGWMTLLYIWALTSQRAF